MRRWSWLPGLVGMFGVLLGLRTIVVAPRPALAIAGGILTALGALAIGLATWMDGWADAPRPEGARAGDALQRTLARLPLRLRADEAAGELVAAGRWDRGGARVEVRTPRVEPGAPLREVRLSLEATIAPAFTAVFGRGLGGEPRLHGGLTPEAYATPRVAAALATALARCEQVSIGRAALEARVGPGASDEDLTAALNDLTALSEALRDPVLVLASAPPVSARPDVEVVATSREAGTCPFCREVIAPDEAVACDGCGAGHHRACFEEHGRCTIHGCGRRSASPRERA